MSGFCAISRMVRVRRKVVSGWRQCSEPACAHVLIHKADILCHGGIVRMSSAAKATAGVSAMTVMVHALSD